MFLTCYKSKHFCQSRARDVSLLDFFFLLIVRLTYHSLFHFLCAAYSATASAAVCDISRAFSLFPSVFPRHPPPHGAGSTLNCSIFNDGVAAFISILWLLTSEGDREICGEEIFSTYDYCCSAFTPLKMTEKGCASSQFCYEAIDEQLVLPRTFCFPPNWPLSSWSG